MTSQMKSAGVASLATRAGGLPAQLLVAFPDTDPGVLPLGSRVLVQLRRAKNVAGKIGNIHIPDSAQEAEKWNTQVAIVRSCGPVAFHRRDNLQPWPEGDWVQPGDFVRVPKWGGDRFEVPMPDGEKALFVIFNDNELLAKVTGDPLTIIAYI